MTQPIKSLLDLDYYKLTQGQFAWKNFPQTQVKYAFTNRSKSTNLSFLAEPLDEVFSDIRKMRYSFADLMYLKQRGIFSDGYLDFLSKLVLPEIYVGIS